MMKNKYFYYGIPSNGPKILYIWEAIETDKDMTILIFRGVVKYPSLKSTLPAGSREPIIINEEKDALFSPFNIDDHEED